MSGHYYSDACQFHGPNRKFQDMHLSYNHDFDQILLDQGFDLGSDTPLRVFAILKRVELSITLDIVSTQLKNPENMTNFGQGVFITDQLFLPRYIWYKMKFALPMIKEKILYFNEIRNLLNGLYILYNKNSA